MPAARQQPARLAAAARSPGSVRRIRIEIHNKLYRTGPVALRALSLCRCVGAADSRPLDDAMCGCDCDARPSSCELIVVGVRHTRHALVGSLASGSVVVVRVRVCARVGRRALFVRAHVCVIDTHRAIAT